MASFEFNVFSSDEESYDDEPAIGLGKMIGILIFLFPLFPLFLLYRFIKHRNQSHNLIKDVFLSGSVVLVLFALSGIFVYTEEPFFSKPSLFILFVFLLPGLALIWQAKRMENNLYERYVKYRDYIYDDGILSIPKLAELAGKRVKVAKNDLKHMVYIGLIDDGFVDDRSNRIVLDGKQRSFGNNLQIEFSLDGGIQFEMTSTTSTTTFCDHPSHSTASGKKAQEPEPAPKPKPKTIQCHGCGASITFIEGETKQCEYCDSMVS
ncbi:hypothetical protein D3C75_779040 [compost metagenome]